MTRASDINVENRASTLIENLHEELTNQNLSPLTEIHIDSIADVDCYQYGKTLLHSATYGGKIAAVNALLKHGANPELKNTFNGCTPLHIATIHHLHDIATLLLQFKANPNTTNFGENTPLHFAAREGDYEMATLLITAGANVRAINNHGISALHQALMRQHYNVAMLLLSAGADANLANKYGRTPIDQAAQNNMKRMQLILTTLTTQSKQQFERLLSKLSKDEIALLLKPLLKRYIITGIQSRANKRPSVFSRCRRTANDDLAEYLYSYVVDGRHSNQLFLSKDQERRLKSGSLHALFEALKTQKPDLQIIINQPPCESLCTRSQRRRI